MKLRHHQLFFEMRVLYMATAPIGFMNSKISAACQPCLSVEKPGRKDFSPLIDVNAFLHEQRPLHGKAALVSAE
jgi:hypothetical protein